MNKKIRETRMTENTINRLMEIIKLNHEIAESKSVHEILFMYDLLSRSADGKFYGHNLFADTPKEEIYVKDLEAVAQHFYKKMIELDKDNFGCEESVKASKKFTQVEELLKGERRTVDLLEL